MKRYAWPLLLVLACGGGEGPGLRPDGGRVDVVGLDLGTYEPSEPDAAELGGREVVPDFEALEEVSFDEGEGPSEGALEVLPPEPCKEGEACDDHDPCTHSDRCKNWVCEGTPYKCNDANSCTHDICDGWGGCYYPIRKDRCLINGACLEDGTRNADNPCLACVAPVSQTEWTPDDGAECDDGRFCTVGDRCVGGQCVGLLPNPCDDNNWCTDDGCDETKGCTHVANNRACSDGDACTVGDHCENKKCVPGAQEVSCDDHNPCTTDWCDKTMGCMHQPNNNPCNDGNVCTLEDRCVDGACVGTKFKDCSDTNPCTDDSCHPVLGCVHKDNREWCDDGNPCTAGDQCQFGQCQAGPGLVNCNDDDPCTVDSCDPKKGCVHEKGSGSPCDDGNPCTLGDFCEAGVCKGGTVVNCDDANSCTTDMCDETGACVHVPNNLPCDDGNPCTLGDTCADGACQPGPWPLACADSNPCTDDACVPPVGCVHTPNNAACSDGDACTVGDRCVAGNCVVGDQVPHCDDVNPCTVDTCVPDKGCVFTPQPGLPCDDGNNCTVGDKCGADGTCQGVSSQCDDGNACTKEICLPNGGCEHQLVDTPECKPEIVVDYPPRGAMLLGPPDSLTVTGKVTSAGGPITEFTINDSQVQPKADGSFAWTMTPASGTNILRFRATNKAGGMAKAVRAFMFSHTYYPADPATVDKARVTDGVAVFLGKTVFDDDDTSTADDFATIIYLLVKGTNIASLIPDPLSVQKIGWCTATIRGKNLKYSGPQVDLYPINGGLHARIRFTNFSMDIKADMSGFACPSASGNVSASAITVEMDLLVSVVSVGNVKVTLANKKAQIDGLDINLDGVLGFLLNWLIDLFSGTITSQVEGMIVKQMDQFASILADALKSLAIHQDLPIPPLLGEGKPVTVTLDAAVSSADFDVFGGTLGLAASAVAQKGVKYQTKGSVGRSDCLQAGGQKFHFVEKNEFEIGLADDLLNQILYSVWYAGTLEMDIDVAALGGGVDLSQYGVSDLLVQLSFMLPPMLTDCTPDSHLAMRVGDIEIRASMKMGGMPIELTAYASADARAKVGVTQTPKGPQLTLGIEKIDVAEVEVESASGGAGAKWALTQLIESQLMPKLFEQFGSGAMTGFAIPDFDLGGMVPGLPPGTKLSLDPKEVYRYQGYSVLSGNVK